MAVFMLGAGLSENVRDDATRNGVTACFLFREYLVPCAHDGGISLTQEQSLQ